jgi:hypothetical protein
MSAIRQYRARSPIYGGVKDYSIIYGGVKVNDDGFVTRAFRGKNKWHSELKDQCQTILDPSIDVFAKQNQQHWATICQTMQDSWEYFDIEGKRAPIAQACLEFSGCRIMKTEQQSLRLTFIEVKDSMARKCLLQLS